MGQDIRGVEVSEAEVATGLGFADIYEFRRWQTEMGRKVSELEHALFVATNNRDNFRATGLNMVKVLTAIAATIDAGEPFGTGNRLAIISDDLRLAIDVVMGKQPDWGGKIRKWLSDDNTTI